MPINLAEIDKLINKYSKSEQEYAMHVDNLKFIREKLLHGSLDERRIIEICTKLTIDSINETIKAIQDSLI